uniref:Nucleoside-triphosphatase, cancer-related n=1 Tax=Rousettus aegyptiacus TaxID=9407 RepID=A0A7J8B9X2_ROUAE|nr:nucleoside-triphosphatase, cancer-related [Rousettus aegyptiacus]
MGRHVFLTGPPGVGKTTLIQKASAALKSSGVPVDGFYTEEVRQGGRRIGFDVVTLSGLRGPLSRVGPEPPPGGRGCRVGQYVVDLTSFEQLALPALSDVCPFWTFSKWGVARHVVWPVSRGVMFSGLTWVVARFRTPLLFTAHHTDTPSPVHRWAGIRIASTLGLL